MKEKIKLTGARETTLATLYGRALDSEAEHPILNDREAARTVEQIDYDFRRTGVNRLNAATVALRARQLDEWTAAFLTVHPTSTVLHLACGLDIRARRLRRPPGVRWIDVDYPQIIELRERLLPLPSGDYRMIAASVTDEDWLAEVPADRPTAVVFEGLSMYLTKAQGQALIEGLTGRFPSGQLLFDACGSMCIKWQRFIPAVRNSGARLSWAIDDPYELEDWHPGLICVTSLPALALPGLAEFPPAVRLLMWTLSKLPGFRDSARLLRYSF